jgi:two-component system, NarL family, captular synthesis response regulator RcsB
MIDKIIIAEDHESANLSVQKTVEEMRIGHIDHVFYCDDALKKIELAKQKGHPYELLITDLSFEADGSPQKIDNGYDLIASARVIQPELRILVFSAEKGAAIIDKLFKTYEIDAYVRKARNDAKELKAALEALSKGRRYYPQTLARLIKQANTYEFTDFDINIIRLLSQGYHQNEIPEYLKRKNIQPSSLSTIEKRLSLIREELGFSKNEQLVLFCKETGIL